MMEKAGVCKELSRLSRLCYLPSTHLTHCRQGTSILLMPTPHFLLLTKGSQGLLANQPL